jgi:hypothetical protein
MVLTPVVRDAAVADVVPAFQASTFGLDKIKGMSQNVFNKRSMRVAGPLLSLEHVESPTASGSFYDTSGIF